MSRLVQNLLFVLGVLGGACVPVALGLLAWPYLDNPLVTAAVLFLLLVMYLVSRRALKRLL